MIVTVSGRSSHGTSVAVKDADDLSSLRAQLDWTDARSNLNEPSQWRRCRHHLWVSVSAVRQVCGTRSEEWQQQFNAMVDYAARQGWIDGEGYVRAHIEPTSRLTEGTDDASAHQGGLDGAESTAGDVPTWIDVADDDRAVRDLFGLIPSGVVVLAARIEGVPVGMVISSFTTVSIDPPLLSVNIRTESSTWKLLQSAVTLGVSVLAAGQHDLARKLSGPRLAERFTGVSVQDTVPGALVIDDAVLALETEIVASTPAGDHHMVVLRIRRCLPTDREPLLFHRSTFRCIAGRA